MEFEPAEICLGITSTRVHLDQMVRMQQLTLIVYIGAAVSIRADKKWTQTPIRLISYVWWSALYDKPGSDEKCETYGKAGRKLCWA